MKKYLLLLCALLAATPLRAADNVILTEFVASNGTGLLDEDGSHQDWIEIYNAGTNTVNLLNWSLTDSAGTLTKWRFPSTNIGPGKFIVVFASNKNRIPAFRICNRRRRHRALPHRAHARAEGRRAGAPRSREPPHHRLDDFAPVRDAARREPARVDEIEVRE